MKGLVVFAVVGVGIGLGGYWVMGNYLMADHGQLIGFACGNPSGENLQLQVVVSGGMVRSDPPKFKAVNDMVIELWDEWIRDHYILTDSSGQRVDFFRQHFGNLIPSGKVGTPNSYLLAMVKPGEAYTFEYVPKLSEGKRYRHSFTVGDDGLPYKRVNFEFVKEG